MTILCEGFFASLLSMNYSVGATGRSPAITGGHILCKYAIIFKYFKEWDRNDLPKLPLSIHGEGAGG